MYRLLGRLGVGCGAAALASTAWVFGTNASAYSGLFVSHQIVAAFLLGSFFVLHDIRRSWSTSHRRGDLWLALAGFLGGWAAISELAAAPVGLLLFAYIVRVVGARKAAVFVAAATVPVALFGAYNALCFGSPVRLGYCFVVNPAARAASAHGFLGIHAARPDVLLKLLFSEHRGLLPLSPYLVLAAPGLVAMIRNPATRREGALCSAVAAYFLALASGYDGWDGGAAMGPRYLVAALPFVTIPTGVVLSKVVRLPGALRVAAASLCATLMLLSVVTCTICVAVWPEFPDDIPMVGNPPRLLADKYHPITGFVFPMFLEGRVGMKCSLPNGALTARVGRGADGTIRILPPDVDHRDDAYNLGEKLGLQGAHSLLPLMGFWLACAGGLAVMVRARGARAMEDTVAP
jgi:hypothetical protein